MHNFHSGWRAALAFPILTALASCADLQRRGNSEQLTEIPTHQRYLELTADQLISFGADLSRLTAAGRLEECHKIMRFYAGNRQLSILVHLFAAQQITTGCGDPSMTTRVIRAFSGQISEERLRNLLLYQVALAERNVAGSAERVRLERRLEHTRYNLRKALSNSRQALSSSKQALSKQREALSEREEALSQTREIYRQMVSRDAEARQLKEKLDALKTIEQDLNDIER